MEAGGQHADCRIDNFINGGTHMDYPFHVHDVNISDPFVLADPVTGKYYLYAAHFNLDRFPNQKRRGVFHALVSENLVNWSEPIQVFDAEATGFWADLDYWAPECHIWQGKYYIISSFRADGRFRRCQCLVADNPLGPFRQVQQEAVTPPGWQCLDGTLYVDKKGKPWMVFCHEWLQVFDGQICAIPMSDDLGSAIGEPIILFRASDAPWAAHLAGQDRHNGFVTDGPFLHRLPDGKLIMLWSNFDEDGYCIALAHSQNGEVDGIWEQETVPLYKRGTLDGHDGGHGMVFTDVDGKQYICCHSPNKPCETCRERTVLIPVREENGTLAIHV
jgi:GH43 family beta-xylosidase